LWSAEYAEAAGDIAGARRYYAEALRRIPYWAVSDYWNQSSLKQDIRNQFLQELGLTTTPLAQLRQLPDSCWASLASSAPPAEAAQDWRCEGEIALRIDHDPERAAALLADAVEAAPLDPAIYILLGEAQCASADLPNAERSARIALFFNAPEANRVIGCIAEARGDLPAAAEAYRRSGPFTLIAQSYTYAVYSRKLPYPLPPELSSPTPSPYHLLPLLSLAHIYQEMGDEQNLQDIVADIQTYDPYFVIEP
jgi:tetratricopeptide (TPR) repeat protein